MAHGPPSIFKASSIGPTSPHAAISLALSLLSPSSTSKDPRDEAGPTQITQDSAPSHGQPMSNLNSICNLHPFVCNVTQSQAAGWDRGHLWGGRYSAYHSPSGLFWPTLNILWTSWGTRVRSHQSPPGTGKKWPRADVRHGLRPTAPDADRPSQLSRACHRSTRGTRCLLCPGPLRCFPTPCRSGLADTASGGPPGQGLRGQQRQPCPGPSRPTRGQEGRLQRGGWAAHRQDVTMNVNCCSASPRSGSERCSAAT